MTRIQTPEEQWSEPERWVWQEIRAGRIADFNAREGRQDAPLEPTTSQGWGEERKLRSDFLKQILLRQPYRSQIPAEGVRIVGAWFPEGVELGHGRLEHQLWLENCRFDGPANLVGLQIDGWFSLEGLAFAEQGKGTISVDLTAAKITGSVNLEGATFKDVGLRAAKIGGYLILDGAKFDGKLDMNGLDIIQHLLMREGATFKDVDLIGAKINGHVSLEGATFKNVDLIGAKVSGQLDLDGAKFEGKLDMNGLDVAQSLFMRNVTTFKNVDLIGAKVGGDLSLDGATFDGKLNTDSLVVEGDLFMRGSTFNETASLIFTRVGRNLDLSNSDLTGLDLSGTRIEGELRLGSDQHLRTRWREGAALNLRNVHVGALQDRRDRVAEQWEDAWPAELQLEGFTYDRLGGFGGTPVAVEDSQGNPDVDVDMQARDIRWYIDWLARDHSYSPQPYEQLAGVFHAAGDPTKSNTILYESRRRARKEDWRQGNYFRWLGSSLLDWTIGYGLGGRYFRALWWVVAFTAVGACVLYFSGQPNAGLAPGLPARLVYSLDQLLPIVEFEKYDKVVLTGGVAYYFYVQKLVGWALGSFLIAGLAGLTQKQ